MTGLRTLTVRQPWASLIAAGVKTIETRSWSTKHQGRIAIHAGASLYDRADTERFSEKLGGPWPILPLGVILATGELADVVPTDTLRCNTPNHSPGWEQHLWGLAARLEGGPLTTFVHEGQLALGDFTVGRFAWLLDDIQPTTERCPACWGTGKAYEDGTSLQVVCVCGDAGHCPPIPARGKQGLWSWSPGGES